MGVHWYVLVVVEEFVLNNCIYCREDVIMSDGGHVSIDWYNEVSPHQPTVLILPGITGTCGFWFVFCPMHVCPL